MSVLEKFNTAVNEAIELISRIEADPHHDEDLAGSDMVNLIDALENVRATAGNVIAEDASEWGVSGDQAMEDMTDVLALVSDRLGSQDPHYDELAMKFLAAVCKLEMSPVQEFTVGISDHGHDAVFVDAPSDEGNGYEENLLDALFTVEESQRDALKLFEPA